MKYVICLSVVLLAGCSSPQKAESLSKISDGRDPAQEHEMATGEAASCNSVGWSDNVSSKQRAVINQIMAAHEHRVQHALWHAMRSSPTEVQKHQVLLAFGSGWKLPHPLCPAPLNNLSDRANYNPAGEDFLYMHRQMIAMVRAALVAQNQPCIKGWETVPDPSEWPLPKGSRSGPKSDQALQLFKQWDSYFQDDKWLGQISLSQLGFAIEFTIHNNLHMRYSEDRPLKRFQAKKADDDGAPLPFNGKFPSNWTYDDPAYNWLADPYGAAVNPIFWKIHGYVDHLIDKWLAAHQKTSISTNCGEDKSCYTWQGRWVGDDTSAHPRTTARGADDSKNADDPRLLRDFHHRRLEHEWWGVVTDADFNKKGGPSNGAPLDPYTTAEQKVCETPHQ